jgi:GT2 family glycosyltransferase
MGTGERVTVVMITHNRRDEALSTLEHMTTLPDAAPIIVVDNASADGTAEAIAVRYPAVELLAAAENLGAIGRNHAVARVRTPYVAFCDDDTRRQPGALTRQTSWTRTHCWAR